MIKSLQSLRAIGALMIFIHHFGFENRIITSFGDCAVNWFMMMSGFVLCAAHENRLAPLYASGLLKPTASDVRRFMVKRIKHIAPLYFLALLLMLFLRRYEFNFASLIASGLMIQSWIPLREFYFGYNSPAWFVSDIMFCYLLFLPLLWFISYYRRGAIRLFVGILVVYGALLWLIPESPDEGNFFFYILPLMQLPSFVIGMIMWQIASKLRTISTPTHCNTLILCALLIIALTMAGYGFFPQRINLSSYWWPSTALLLIILTITDSANCLMSRLLHWRPLIALGNASMAFYLLHLPWLYASRILLDKLNQTIPAAIQLPGSILLLALISVAIHRTLKTK